MAQTTTALNVQDITCSITGNIMKNPVMAADGHTYDNDAILEWFAKCRADGRPITSPLTGAILPNDTLLPNYALKNVIETNAAILSTQPPKPPAAGGAMAATGSSSIVSVDDPRLTIQSNYIDGKLHIAVSPPTSSAPLSQVHFVSVIDNSGSMSTGVSATNASGQTENHGYWLLDLVKYSITVLISSLYEENKKHSHPIYSMSLVKFSDTAKIIIENVVVDDYGKSTLLRYLNQIQPAFTTNIWGGVKVGLDLSAKYSEMFTEIMVFTDGVPNIHPPSGYESTLTRYTKSLPHSQYNISTFGFGFNLNSDLLESIALMCNGSYNYIPDVSIMGSIFINYIADITCRYYVSDVHVHISSTESESSLSSDQVCGFYSSCTKSDGPNVIDIHIPNISCGQSKNLVINLPTSDKIQVELRYSYKQKPFGQVSTIQKSEFTGDQMKNMILHNMRSDLCDILKQMLGMQLESAQLAIREFIRQCREIGTSAEIINQDSFYQALIIDLEGEFSTAFSRVDWFQKWGEYYIRSVWFAHGHERCNNFKDQSVSLFGGDWFREQKENINLVFDKTTPPKPSQVTSTTTSVAASGGMTQVYNNSSSICFHGHCKIKMGDGSTKLLCNIRTGETVSTPYGNTSVKFITKQECINGVCEMVVFQKTGLIVTPTHPIKYNDKWVHPKMIYEPSVIKTGYIYNLVLYEHHSCYINDMECITIGHGQTADILSSYFGTCEAVNDLSALGIQSDGFVHIPHNSIWRNKEGYVCKISVDL